MKVPEHYRLTERVAKTMAFLGPEIQTLISDAEIGNNGYFYLPKLKNGKGNYFLCKAMSDRDGWDCVAVNIPSVGRCATWEELHRIKSEFFGEDAIVMMFNPGKDMYIGSNYWVHMWQHTNPHLMFLPPIFDSKHHFKKRGFWEKLWHAIKESFTKK